MLTEAEKKAGILDTFRNSLKELKQLLENRTVTTAEILTTIYSTHGISGIERLIRNETAEMRCATELSLLYKEAMKFYKETTGNTYKASSRPQTLYPHRPRASSTDSNATARSLSTDSSHSPTLR